MSTGGATTTNSTTTAAAAASSIPSPLVEVSWLQQNLSRVIPLDASWHMPSTGRNAYQEFIDCRLENARYFDIDQVAAPKDAWNLPHMLPSAEDFERAMGKLGIDPDDHVVVYDRSDVRSSYRAYWTLQVFGHRKVSVLNGGLAKWLSQGLLTVKGTPSSLPATAAAATTTYKVNRDYRAEKVKHFEQIVRNLRTHEFQVVDARSAGRSGGDGVVLVSYRFPPFPLPYFSTDVCRFQGTAPEPRPGLPSGHIPNSINIPFTEVLDGQSGCMRSREELVRLFAKKGVPLDGTKPLTFSCGSGVTASVVAFAAEQAGATNVSIYDGSWTEYASYRGALSEES